MNDEKKLAVAKLISTFVTRTCPHCLGEYTLNVDGTKDGCDGCQGIVRDQDGSIIQDDFAEMFTDEAQS